MHQAGIIELCEMNGLCKHFAGYRKVRETNDLRETRTKQSDDGKQDVAVGIRLAAHHGEPCSCNEKDYAGEAQGGENSGQAPLPAMVQRLCAAYWAHTKNSPASPITAQGVESTWVVSVRRSDVSWLIRRVEKRTLDCSAVSFFKTLWYSSKARSRS